MSLRDGQFSVGSSQTPLMHIPAAHCELAEQLAPPGRPEQLVPPQLFETHWPPLVQGPPLGWPPPSQSAAVQTPEAQSLLAPHADPDGKPPEQMPLTQAPEEHCELRPHEEPGGRIATQTPPEQLPDSHWPLAEQLAPSGAPAQSPATQLLEAHCAL